MKSNTIEKPVDALGNKLNAGDRVFCYDIDGSKQYGILQPNEYKHVSDWCVFYDDGEDCAVLDFNSLFKA